MLRHPGRDIVGERCVVAVAVKQEEEEWEETIPTTCTIDID
jgi:hypothetical protein